VCAWRHAIQKGNRGTVLIFVLWILVLVTFIAGHYSQHNRQKAGLAANAWDALVEREAVDSVLQLFATEQLPFAGEAAQGDGWIHLAPGGLELWAREGDESGRINLNTGSEAEIRTKIRHLLGDEGQEQADHLADAILDWRDADTLVRTNGAEADYYEDQGLPYGPANGPFKVMTELLLVRGVTPGLFWGDPMTAVRESAERWQEDEQALPEDLSLAEAFTVYPEGVKRVSIIVPGKRGGYLFTLASLHQVENRWEVLHLYRTTLAEREEEKE
jgi:hypothetical protein